MVRVRLTMADWDGNETSALRKIFGGSPWCSRGLVLYTADTRDRARVDNRLRSLTSWPWGKPVQVTQLDRAPFGGGESGQGVRERSRAGGTRGVAAGRYLLGGGPLGDLADGP